MRKFISTSCLIALSALAFSLMPVRAIDALDSNTFNDFDIISADKLNYTDGHTELSGDVKVKFGDFEISSPRVVVTTDSEGSPTLIDFLNDPEHEVRLESKDITVDATTMQVDLATSLFKCFANEDGTQPVRSLLKSDGEDVHITAHYQEYNLDTGLSKAKGSETEQMILTTQERTFYANEGELKYTKGEKKNSAEYIDFYGDVVLIEADKRVEAQDLYYWVAGDMFKATNEVKIAHTSKEHGLIHLFADHVIFENELDQLSAFSTSLEPNVTIYAKDMYGKGRQLVMQQANAKANKAVLSGSAYAQFDDKAVAGDEVLFDIEKKEIVTLVGRPKTHLLTSSSKKKKNKS